MGVGVPVSVGAWGGGGRGGGLVGVGVCTPFRKWSLARGSVFLEMHF